MRDSSDLHRLRNTESATDEREVMGGLACMRAPDGDDVKLKSADVRSRWMMRSIWCRETREGRRSEGYREG